MTADLREFASIPLLERLSNEQRQQVVAAGAVRSCQRGEIVFHEGETAEALFVVLEGQVKLVRYSPRGREMLLHQRGDDIARALRNGDFQHLAAMVQHHRFGKGLSGGG